MNRNQWWVPMSNTNDGVMLEVSNLNKQFGTFQAIRNLNFQVRRGEVFGFLGPNGAGKTTTMRIVTCFIPATSGQVKVAGFDTVERSFEVRSRLGYLPENNPLYNDMQVIEYLRFVARIRAIPEDRVKSRIDEMFALCGLSNMANREIGKLSKGYRQRVGLAQAIIHDPDLLILDEPMSGLDPNQIVEIRQLIKQIGQEKTVIYCSHILPEVSATCSRIMIINDGQIVASGTAEELMQNHQRGMRYTLRLTADPAQAVSAFSALPSVSNATADVAGEGHCKVAITGSGSADIGEELFRCVVDNGWSLSELRRESASLEDVFTQLTRGR